ncbi:MAG: hypothetical protein CMG04_01235 [Candidatus Marinimicrobia bacterium]|nr:hypothetical protein [Candidatus Neomarinimicrobiota bacterium]
MTMVSKLIHAIASTVIIATFFNCAQNSYLVLAKKDPNNFVAEKDALKGNLNSNKNYLAAIIFSHKELGLKALNENNFKDAIYHFKEALFYDNGDSLSIYNLNLAKGHKMYLTGNTDNLWEAIQFYSKAAQASRVNGEPFYYIGLSYYKLDNEDFDLILESFNSALELSLPQPLRDEIVGKKIETETRKEKLKAFWN